MGEDRAAAWPLFQKLVKIAEGCFLTRNLVSEPANVLFPKSFAAEARKLEKLGVKVTVLGEKEMKKLGMGALLGVAQGSATEPQLLVMRWDGAGAKGGAPLAFVGRSEEHTSELQSLMRISYAVFCLKKKTNKHEK